MALPNEAGFYWAKRLFVEYDNGIELEPLDEWEVVAVYENSLRAEDRLRVLVIGVEQSRAISDFAWGPGPLKPPAVSSLVIALLSVPIIPDWIHASRVFAAAF